MNIQRLFENFRKFISEDELFEGRLEDIKKKYKGIEHWVEKISENDPSGNNKYLDWMVGQFVKMSNETNTSTFEILEHLAIIVKKFHQNIQRLKEKDINKYGSVEDLKTALSQLGSTSKEKRGKEKQSAIEGSEIIYEDKNFFIIRPNTEESSCYYGKNTRWCISATTSKNYFGDYTKEGRTFYFLRNENLSEDDARKKFAFVYMGGKLEEIFNALDDSVNENTVLAGMVRNLYGDPNISFEERAQVENTFENFKKLMSEHSLENQPVKHIDPEEKFYEITDAYENKYKHSFISYNFPNDQNVLIWGGSKIDLSYLDWKVEYLGDIEEDIIIDVKTVLDDNNVDYEDVELWNGAEMGFNILYPEHKLNPEDYAVFETFAKMIEKNDFLIDGIVMKEIKEALYRAGYIT